MASWHGDFQHGHARLLQVAQQARPVGPRAFDADADGLAERAHPGQHPLVALARAGKAFGAQDAVPFIDHRRDVQVLVGIDAADDLADARFLIVLHDGSPVPGHGDMALPEPNAWTRQ